MPKFLLCSAIMWLRKRVRRNLERSTGTNQDRPVIRFPRKHAGMKFARCAQDVQSIQQESRMNTRQEYKYTRDKTRVKSKYGYIYD